MLVLTERRSGRFGVWRSSGRTDGLADRRRLINIGTATKIESSTSHVISTLLPYLSAALLSPVLCTSRRVRALERRRRRKRRSQGSFYCHFFKIKSLCFWLTFGIQRQWRSFIGEFSLIGLQSIYYESRKILKHPYISFWLNLLNHE